MIWKKFTTFFLKYDPFTIKIGIKLLCDDGLKCLPLDVCHGVSGIISEKTGKGPLKIALHSLDQCGWLQLSTKRLQAGYTPIESRKKIIGWGTKEVAWTSDLLG